MDEGEDAVAIEASPEENAARLPMDEIDQYEAFAALLAQRKTSDEIVGPVRPAPFFGNFPQPSARTTGAPHVSYDPTTTKPRRGRGQPARLPGGTKDCAARH